MTALLTLAGIATTARLVDGIGRRHRVRTLQGIDLAVEEGGTLGLLGEDDAGLAALRDLLLGQAKPASGSIAWQGGAFDRKARRRIGYLPANAAASLDPYLPVLSALKDGVRHAALPWRERGLALAEVLTLSGLSDAEARRPAAAFPPAALHRIALARALAGRPALLLLDQPGAELDLPGRAALLNHLCERRNGCAVLALSHDPVVLGVLGGEVAVLQYGRVVERGPATSVLAEPRHPFTLALTAATRAGYGRAQGEERAVAGPPSWSPVPPPGCGFEPRCPRAGAVCRSAMPGLKAVGEGRQAACHFVEG